MTAIVRRIGMLIAATLATAGCNVTHDVGQNTTPAHRVYALPEHGKLSVRPLLDRRAEDAQNRAVLSAGDELEVKGETQCVNGEQKYGRTGAPIQVTSFLSKRIRDRGAFDDVKVSGAGRYVLSGSLAAFYGRQEISGAARTGQMFGLIGALATAGATTDGLVRVALRDLVLEDTITGQRVRLEDVEVTRQGELPASASCMVIYQNVDQALSDAATELAQLVENAVTGGALAPSQAIAAVPTGETAYGEITVTAVYARASTPSTWQNAEAAEVRINGRAAGVTPLRDGLPPGRYSVEVRYGGAPAQRFDIDVVAGQHRQVEARLVLPPTAEELAAEQAARAEIDRANKARYDAAHRAWQARMEERAPARRDLLVASIATAVGGAAALITGIVLKDSAADTDDQIQSDRAAWERATEQSVRAAFERDIRALESERNRDDMIGNILAVTGGAALVTSVVLLAIRPSALEEPTPVMMTVGADQHGAALRLSGSF